MVFVSFPHLSQINKKMQKQVCNRALLTKNRFGKELEVSDSSHFSLTEALNKMAHITVRDQCVVLLLSQKQTERIWPAVWL